MTCRSITAISLKNGRWQAGADPTPQWVLQDQQRQAALYHGFHPYQAAGVNPNATNTGIHPNCDACSTNISDTSLYKEPRQRSAPKIRRYPAHWCGFECCFTFPENEHGLLGKDLDHIPVCHTYCWRIEAARLLQNSALSIMSPKLPMCHRQCYFTSLWRVRRPDVDRAAEIEYIPRNRSLAERCRIPKLQHYVLETAEKISEVESPRRRNLWLLISKVLWKDRLDDSSSDPSHGGRATALG